MMRNIQTWEGVEEYMQREKYTFLHTMNSQGNVSCVTERSVYTQQ